MRGRLTWLLFGVVFSVTLALIVGQRLSSESMAVVIGVIAGVAASIPTSLIVVWFMGHNTAARPIVEAGPARSAEPAEPRIVVMPAPQAPMPHQPQPAYAGMAGYGPQSYAGYAPLPEGYAQAANPAYAAAPALPARRFTVIGGSDTLVVEEPAYLEESVTWQR
jgi:hypothetical protein